MPYKSGKYGKSGKKRKFSKKRQSYPTMAMDPMSAIALANLRSTGNNMRFNHPANVEAKQLDVQVYRGLSDLAGNASTANTISVLADNISEASRIFVGPGITAGTGATERIGRQIYVKHVQYRLQVYSSISFEDTLFRLVMVLDRQNNRDANNWLNGTGVNMVSGTGMTAIDRFRDIFDDHQFTAGYARTLSSFRKLSNSSRYKVLLDKFINLKGDSVAAGDTFSKCMLVQGIVPVREKFEYHLNTNAITELTSNCLHFYLIPWTGQTHAGRVSVFGVIRLRYLDA